MFVYLPNGSNFLLHIAGSAADSSFFKITSPQPVKRIRLPMSSITETEKMKDILMIVKNSKIHILQCFGVHGSGKTQTVLKLADKFPYPENEDEEKQEEEESKRKAKLCIKWQIQCSDSEHDIKKELENLAEELQLNGFISRGKVYSICRDLRDNLAGPLVQALSDCNAHVLLVIEDPKDASKKLLKDLCEELNKKKLVDQRECKFHLYLTCRREDQVLTKYERRSLIQSETVTGFSEKEAIAFLNEASIDGTMGNEAAREIFQRFSGLPLGLQVARGYCTQSRIDYVKYLKLVKNDEAELEKNEKQMIENEYGDGAEHVFQAIVMPFFPQDENFELNLHWNILSCLAYFHHDGVPIALLKRCCYMFSDVSSRQKDLRIETRIGQLVTKLLNHGMCSELNRNEILFHQVVLIAFRVRHKAIGQNIAHLKKTGNLRLYYLKKAIDIMCSLVSKDMRQKSSSVKMSKYLPHLLALLNHVAFIHETFENDPEFRLYKALLSHLYEVTATIMSGQSHILNKQCDVYFQKSLKLLWEESDEFIKLDQGRFVPVTSNIEELSEKIVQLSQGKGRFLPKNFSISYASKLYYCFDENEMQKICGEQFDSIKDVFNSHDSKEDLIKKLQECQLFLQDNDYHSVFYSERLATILHSWSRALLYADPKTIKEDKKSEWLSSLSRCVSNECKSKCQVHLLSEWITITSGVIPIWLKQRRPDSYLDKVLHLSLETLARQEAMQLYENGVKKECIIPSKHVFSKLSLLRSIVRANTRLKNLNQLEAIVLEEKDQKCEELAGLSFENKDFSSSSTCIVYCAKYFGARKQFTRCMDCFQKYFSMIANQETKFVLKCWAIYNFARAVQSDKNASNEDIIDAMKKCEDALNTNDVMSERLDKLIKQHLERLKERVEANNLNGN